VPKSTQYLLIGSLEAYSGKSASILGIAHQLQAQGWDIAYGKPLSGDLGQLQAQGDDDLEFVAQTLGLSADRLQTPLLTLDAATVQKRIMGEDCTNYQQALQQQVLTSAGDIMLLEGPGTLDEGRLFNLSLLEVADAVNAKVLIVTRFNALRLLDGLLMAKQRLGDRLLGVLINDVPTDQLEMANQQLRTFLEQQGIAVYGVLPSSILLRSVSVGELVRQLQAEVLCRPDRLDLMVESLTIGAMNVNSALKYFRARHNMAVVTGGDRTDLQLAALETSTQCLILTGQIPPSKVILSRAEDLEIPILSVDLDTLSTVEIVDRAFGQVRVHEPIKVQCVCQLIAEYFDCDRLFGALGLSRSMIEPNG
jgi:uncharacterized protein